MSFQYLMAEDAENREAEQLADDHSVGKELYMSVLEFVVLTA